MVAHRHARPRTKYRVDTERMPDEVRRHEWLQALLVVEKWHLPSSRHEFSGACRSHLVWAFVVRRARCPTAWGMLQAE